MTFLTEIFSMAMLLSTLRMAIPLIFGSVGGTICERSGIVNLGIEGMMLAGAFGAVAGTHVSGSPWIGILTAIAVGGGFGFLHAVLCVKFKTNQSVSGIGINIFVGGITIVLTRAIWNTDGLSGKVTKLPSFSVPFLKDIPVIGPLFHNQSPYLIFAILVVVIAWFVLYRTKAGLRLRAIGDHPQAASSVGINVNQYRYAAVTICGMLCGMGGAYLSIVQNTMFVQNMTAGRGYMALAAMIFGGWNPVGAACGCLIFAFAQAVRIQLDIPIPDQLLQMLPYVITLAVLILAGRSRKGPEASGVIEE